MKTFMVLNLGFASNTILSCFFFFYWSAVITEIFIVIVELAIPRVPIKEAKLEIETQQKLKQLIA